MSAPPADQYYLYVIALSKSVTLTDLVAALTERLGPLQLVELVTAPPIVPEPPPPWWHGLAADARVTPVRDGVPVLGPERRQVVYRGVPMVRNMGAVLVVSRAPTEADKAAGWLQVFGDRPPFPGGLYVAAADVGPG